MCRQFLAIFFLISLFFQQPPLKADALPSSIYDIHVKTIDGQDVSLSTFRGRVLLIVNVASQCGFSSQLTNLENLNQKYGQNGLSILAFPSSDFMNQESGTVQDIKEVYYNKYHITFPLFEKTKITGKDCSPLYMFLTSSKTDPKFSGDVYWNFTKFLINRNGEVIGRFNTITNPEDSKMVEALEIALAS
jgi:glutathione peroxidase